MNNTFGLSASVMSSIVGAIASIENVSRALIYGSRAKGNYRDNSDIDITLEGKNLTVSDLATLDERLDNLLLPWQIDLSIKSRITNVALLDEIERWGKVVFER